MLSALLMFLFYLVILGLIIWLVLYVINVLPLPAPFGQIARVVVIVVGCIILIMLLWDFAGQFVGAHTIRPLR